MYWYKLYKKGDAFITDIITVGDEEVYRLTIDELIERWQSIYDYRIIFQDVYSVLVCNLVYGKIDESRFKRYNTIYNHEVKNALNVDDMYDVSRKFLEYYKLVSI